jgi:hypothetical protein
MDFPKIPPGMVFLMFILHPAAGFTQAEGPKIYLGADVHETALSGRTRAFGVGGAGGSKEGMPRDGDGTLFGKLRLRARVWLDPEGAAQRHHGRN